MEGSQKTLRRVAALSGVGLHTGKPVRAVFRPAPANTGLRFFRSDLESPSILARPRLVVETRRGTTLGLGDARIHTVEHVLSACHGLGIDNLDIHLDAPEPPAMDGSALAFAEAFLSAGIESLPDAPRRRLLLPGPVVLEEGASSYRAEPSDRFSLSVTYENEHPLLGRQTYTLEVEPSAYIAEVAPARTFCFEFEIEALRAAGLAQGGSLDNVVVVGEKDFKSKDGLRYPDEFVRHKMLDFIGDLALVGRDLDRVRISAVRTGHAMNVRFAHLLNDAAMSLRKR